jgi:hypothetical protein
VYSLSVPSAFLEVGCSDHRRTKLVNCDETAGMCDLSVPLIRITQIDGMWQLSRQIFDRAVQWAVKANKTSFWRGNRQAGAKLESPRESVVSIRKTGSLITRNKSEELARLFPSHSEC